MLFNSIQFICFFLVVFVIYWLLAKKCKFQNWLLLVSSYFFYSVADWRMCVLLLVATVIFYNLGLAIEKYREVEENKASFLKVTGVILGVGVLIYFKYLNWFIEGFSELFNLFGLHTNPRSFNIIMPIGVSFFTFKLVSYIIDIHRFKMDATRSFVNFATYISFFPTIMSGPIDRPNKFIPQLQKVRVFNSEVAISGVMQFFWGMVMKMCVADRIAIYADEVLTSNLSSYDGATVTIACILYAVQDYTDFAGYSDMAIGVGKLLGINVTQNFNYPFFGRNVAEFWRRWHISLTTWITDYVFTPLNVKFRNWGNWGMSLAIIINMVLIGMWHGANWSYALFGLYQGLLFVPLIFSGSFASHKKIMLNSWNLPPLKDVLKMCVTFLLFTIGLIIFRSNSIHEMEEIVYGIFRPWSVPYGNGLSLIIFGIFIVLFHDLHHAFGAFRFLDKIPVELKTFLYAMIVLLFSTSESSQFIYFQF